MNGLNDFPTANLWPTPACSRSAYIIETVDYSPRVITSDRITGGAPFCLSYLSGGSPSGPYVKPIRARSRATPTRQENAVEVRAAVT